MKQTVSKAVFFGPDASAGPSAATVSWSTPATRSVCHAGQALAHFTPRQLDVLALLCEGLPNKLICRRLNIATGTVKVHISCILRELGVMSRLQAVVAARGHGLDAMIAGGTPEEDDAPVARRRAKAAGASGGAGSDVIGLGI